MKIARQPVDLTLAVRLPSGEDQLEGVDVQVEGDRAESEGTAGGPPVDQQRQEVAGLQQSGPLSYEGILRDGQPYPSETGEGSGAKQVVELIYALPDQ